MEENICRQCRHFRQHYVLDDQTCTAICCGHCVFPRLKNRRPGLRAFCGGGAGIAGQQRLPDYGVAAMGPKSGVSTGYSGERIRTVIVTGCAHKDERKVVAMVREHPNRLFGTGW